MEHIYITRLNSSTFVKRIEKNTVLSDYVFDEFTTISCEYKKAHNNFQEYKYNKYNIVKNFSDEKIKELFNIVIIYDVISDGYVVLTNDYKYSFIIYKMLTISNTTSQKNLPSICEPTSALKTYKSISQIQHMNTEHPFKTFCMETEFSKFFHEKYNYSSNVFEINKKQIDYIHDSMYRYFSSFDLYYQIKKNSKNKKSKPRKEFDLNDSYTYSCRDYFTNINRRPPNKMQFVVNRNIIWTKFPYYISIYNCPLGKNKCLIHARTNEICNAIQENILNCAREFLIKNYEKEKEILKQENKATIGDATKKKLYDEKIYIANFNKNYNHIRLFGNENPSYYIIDASNVRKTERVAGSLIRKKILQYRILSQLKESSYNNAKQSYPGLLSKV